MKIRKQLVVLLLCGVILLSGCAARTVDEMYQLPKRSEAYNDLQTAIDSAMEGLEYCAPIAGENQQTVQMADLDGDDIQEYLLFAKAKDTAESPLRILIFRKTEESVELIETISSNGTAFDQVEYAQMDSRAGLEIVVGTQVSEQVLRSVCVYAYTPEGAAQILGANYSKMLMTDLDNDARGELFLLRPGQSENDPGIAELYGIENGAMERYNEASMSQRTENLKRIVSGKLESGESAIYVASTVDETAIITDVYTLVDGVLTNVSFSNESGTAVQTMRNYYVYGDDIDDDGVVELPSLINMTSPDGSKGADRHDLIRWYAMKSDGTAVDKLYTFHNFVGGWYMRLDSSLATRISVQPVGNSYVFYLWDDEGKTAERIFTIYAFTAQNREALSTAEGRFALLKTESVIYAAYLEDAAESKGITRDMIMNSFRLIQQDWKTGEM